MLWDLVIEFNTTFSEIQDLQFCGLQIQKLKSKLLWLETSIA